jgi:hypothetical protein
MDVRRRDDGVLRRKNVNGGFGVATSKCIKHCGWEWDDSWDEDVGLIILFGFF